MKPVVVRKEIEVFVADRLLRAIREVYLVAIRLAAAQGGAGWSAGVALNSYSKQLKDRA